MTEEILDRVVQRVAAGLRATERKPTALLFVDDVEDWTWDTPTCCGLPVFHTSIITDDSDCLFIPVWPDDYQYSIVDVDRFRKAYADET